jgi:hypothetical protein
MKMRFDVVLFIDTSRKLHEQCKNYKQFYSSFKIVTHGYTH